MLIPWLLVIFGTIFLLENFNLIPEIRWSIVWPVILILAGLYLMKKKNGGNCCGWREEKQEEKKEDKHQ